MQYTSDLEKSNIQLNLVPINLPEFLRQKVQDYELQAHQKEVELILKMQGNIQSPIQIDVDRLTRILIISYPTVCNTLHQVVILVLL